MDIKEILTRYNELCEDNDWQVYHTPKNLASAICVSSAKTLEHFQWVTEEESLSLSLIPQRKQQVAREIADTFFLLLSLAQKSGIDLEEAVLAKAKKDALEHRGVPDELD